MVDCGRVFHWLYPYLDAAFSPSGGQEIEAHLERCWSCYLEKEFGLFLKKTIRNIENERMAPDNLKKELILMLG
jgi:hypothetical protein